jgi:P-type E1-E2 ATPase
MLTVPVLGVAALHDLVLDFNGTLAVDGKLAPGVAERLVRLSEQLKIHVVTADTFGTARAALAGLPCTVHTLATSAQAEAKRDYVLRLGATTTACIGNGCNDVAMLRIAALAIAVLQGEGAAPQALMAAHVVAPGACEALDLLLQPLRLTATLRT